MQRQIKFRGLTVNGKWVYGLLAHPLGMYPGDKRKLDAWYISNSAGQPFAFEVRPETVGQFTGEQINGVDLYEGDVIKFSRIFGFHGGLLNEWKDTHGLDTINDIGSLFKGVVMLDPLRGLMLKRLNNNYAEPFFTRHQDIKANHDWDTAEIIGNIHQNPELATAAGG